MTNLGGLHALAERREDGFDLRALRRTPRARSSSRRSVRKACDPCKAFTVLLGKNGEQRANLLLPAPAGLDLFEARRLVPLVARGEVLERGLVLQPRDALGAAWKLSRSGRSTVILWKPKSALSNTLLTTRSRRTGALVTGSSSVKARVSPSRKLPWMRAMSPIWSVSPSSRSPILLRLLPRLFFILTKKSRASMSWILPLRSGSLRLVSTQM